MSLEMRPKTIRSELRTSIARPMMLIIASKRHDHSHTRNAESENDNKMADPELSLWSKNTSSDDGSINTSAMPAERAVASAYEVMISTKEKAKLQVFRLMVGSILMMTIAVTILAFFLLGREESRNFETAVRFILC